MGVDIESQFFKFDIDREGSLPTHIFRLLLKWLPIGLVEKEIDHIMNNEIVYTNSGEVDYLVVLNDPKFL